MEKRGRGELYLNEIEPKLFEDYKTWRVTTRGNSSLEGINKTLTPLFNASVGKSSDTVGCGIKYRG